MLFITGTSSTSAHVRMVYTWMNLDLDGWLEIFTKNWKFWENKGGSSNDKIRKLEHSLESWAKISRIFVLLVVSKVQTKHSRK